MTQAAPAVGAMFAAHAAGDQAPPLGPEHLRTLSEARRAARKVRRAARIAAVSGWTTLFFGALTLVTGLTDLGAWLLGGALCAAGWNELRGGKMLRRFDERGAKVLACNQACLGVALAAYAVWKLVAPAETSITAQAATGDEQMDALLSGMERTVTLAVYGTLAVVGLVVPGLTALYYRSKGAKVRAFLAETPAWAAEVVRGE